VERLPSGDVVKSPWSGSRAAECRRGMTTEAQIYRRLGPHQRLAKIINWNADECSLTMEYLPNGNLKDYLRAHNNEISTIQRLQWILEAAEGLQLLHSANIMHCDVEPKNFLLDADLGLRIADFSGSSLDGSQGLACAGTRFAPPGFNWRCAPTVQDDLYSLGSTIYTILTSHCPYHELPSDEVTVRYEAHQFPDLTEIPCGQIIRRCWRSEVASAQEVYDFIQAEKKKQLVRLPFHSGTLQPPRVASCTQGNLILLLLYDMIMPI